MKYINEQKTVCMLNLESKKIQKNQKLKTLTLKNRKSQ